MTWSYDPTATGFTLELNQIRLLIEDTTSGDQLLLDEEITYLAALEGGVQQGAARCAETLAAKFARQADKDVGQLSIKYSQKSAAYLKLADFLRASAGALALPTFGGISISDRTNRENDSDRVMPAFYVGMLDNPPRLAELSTS